MAKLKLDLPYRYEPRPYQIPFFKAMDRGIKRALLVHHRRAGKDLACFNFMIKEAYRVVGNYYYMFPEYNQARKAIWEGKTDKGLSYLGCIPKEIIESVDKQNMIIRLNNGEDKEKGSIIRLVGSDSDRLVGGGLKGIVLSEYSLIKPSVWRYIEPMIVGNDGWAVFNGTPRGENHFYNLYEMAKNNPRWFVSLKTIEDTNAISLEKLDEIRQEGTSTEEDIQQEYYCSFKSSISGAYYSEHFQRADKEGRLMESLEYDENLEVHTVWDLGVADSTAIWFYQLHNNQIRIIDCYEAAGEGLPHYVKVLRDKPYLYGRHYAPHDIKVRELGTGKTRLEQARDLGLRFDVVPKLPITDGINCTRSLLSRCYFNMKKCYEGVQALKQYRKDYNNNLQRFDDRPLHDWTSHYADAFRYLCVSLDEKIDRNKPRQVKAIGDYIIDSNARHIHVNFQPRQTSYLNNYNSWL